MPGDAYEYLFDINGKRASYYDVDHGWEIQGQTYWGTTPVEFYEDGYAQFQHQDWLGTERMRTNNAGAIDGKFSSLPFGDGYSVTGNDNDGYHFAGMDGSHAQFREYSSTQGRWMSPDRYSGSYDFSNPQSFNRYAYVMNNPVSAIDPLGLMQNFPGEPGQPPDPGDPGYPGGGRERVVCAQNPFDPGDPGDPDDPSNPSGDIVLHRPRPMCSPTDPVAPPRGRNGGPKALGKVNNGPRSGYESLFCLGDALKSNGLSLVLDAVVA